MKGTVSRLLIHLEPQDRWTEVFPKRMFGYFSLLTHKFDCPVYPIAIFTFKSPRRQVSTKYTMDIAGFQPLVFQFRAVQLNRLSWRQFLKEQNPVAAALMATMKMDPKERPRVKAECLRMIMRLDLDHA